MNCTCCGSYSASTAAWCGRCYSWTTCLHNVRVSCSCGNTQKCGTCRFDVKLANQGLADYARMLAREDEA